MENSTLKGLAIGSLMAGGVIGAMSLPLKSTTETIDDKGKSTSNTNSSTMIVRSASIFFVSIGVIALIALLIRGKGGPPVSRG